MTEITKMRGLANCIIELANQIVLLNPGADQAMKDLIDEINRNIE